MMVSPATVRSWTRDRISWRDPAQVTSQWEDAVSVDRRLLQARASKGWWSLLERLAITLVVTREYEHLVVALSAANGRPRQSYMVLPHPSGIVADRRRQRLHIASTRNPNQIFTLAAASATAGERRLVPVETTFYQGSLYLHDLAIIAGRLYGNAVGQNAIVRLEPNGGFTRVWWPRCIERGGRPEVRRNHIQLNSIAAGLSLRDSFFSASSTSLDSVRPGHLRYPVNRRGVVFSGRTREPICGALTRPHSARLWRRRLWVANSGYGELGIVSDGTLEVVRTLPGWTRGLCLIDDIAFVGTSRVIPKFARYAPGLDLARSRCSIHAIAVRSGELVASLEWPQGNQIFGIEWLPASCVSGFVFDAARSAPAAATQFFYRYGINHE